MQPSDAHVHVIATGGTISSHFDGADWTNLTGAELVDEVRPAKTRPLKVAVPADAVAVATSLDTVVWPGVPPDNEPEVPSDCCRVTVAPLHVWFQLSLAS